MLLPIQQSIAAYNIGPDDVLRISVYGYDDLKTETRVSADGRITFPLIGEVHASGKSSMELEEAIAVRLIKGGFIHDAQVSVTVLDQCQPTGIGAWVMLIDQAVIHWIPIAQ